MFAAQPRLNPYSLFLPEEGSDFLPLSQKEPTNFLAWIEMASDSFLTK